MYENFHAHNFRGFDAFALEGMGRVNLISGANNSGKTAALEALFLHASGPFAGRTAIRSLRPARGLSNMMTGDDVSPWDVLFPNYRRESTIRLEAAADGGNYRLRLKVPRPGPGGGVATTADESVIEGLSSQPLEITEERDDLPPQTYTERLIIGTTTDRASIAIGQQYVISFELTPRAIRPFKQLSFLASRTRSNHELLAQRYSDLRRRASGDFLLRALKLLEPRLRDVEVLVLEGSSQLHANLGRRELVPLALMGEGMSVVADFVLAMYATPDGTLLVDEIENGIHYSVLEGVWRVLDELSKETGVQLVVTTHSRECQFAAASAMHDSNDLRFFRLRRVAGKERGKQDVTAVDRYDQDLISAAIDMDLDLR